MEMSVNLMPWLLYPRARIPFPTEYEAEKTPEPVWTFWRIKNLLPLPEFKLRTIQPVA